ncbi:MAG: N-acetyl-gamma-glutamyl-phosphate reductase, partial [Candidatus Thioglobus sp.]
GVALEAAGEFVKKGIKVIDLGADFRLQDQQQYQNWYGIKHTQNELLAQAVYGLPEVYREQIKNANLIANPGCYPSAIILALKPLLEANAIDTKSIIADCKSGVSGAGRAANVATLFCEVNESLKPYNVNHHRHKPETEQTLSAIAGVEVDFIFTPHLVPMSRGMLACVYVDLLADIDAQKLFENSYTDEHFVTVLGAGSVPETRSVRGSNFCQIGVQKTADNKRLIVMSVIDNLVKGASGQAVQNMNILFGLDEKSGLEQIGLLP